MQKVFLGIGCASKMQRKMKQKLQILIERRE